MKPMNSNFSYCPSCGNKIYNYEDRCSECGTFKVIFEELRQDATTSCCKHCGCILQNDFTYCPSCGNIYKKAGDINEIYDYEATNTFLKIMRASRAALLALFFAIHAAWCSVFGIFYGIILAICSLICIGIQLYSNIHKKYKERKFSYIFIILAAIMLAVAIIVMIVAAQIWAELANSVIDLLFNQLS